MFCDLASNRNGKHKILAHPPKNEYRSFEKFILAILFRPYIHSKGAPPYLTTMRERGEWRRVDDFLASVPLIESL